MRSQCKLAAPFQTLVQSNLRGTAIGDAGHGKNLDSGFLHLRLPFELCFLQRGEVGYSRYVEVVTSDCALKPCQ